MICGAISIINPFPIFFSVYFETLLSCLSPHQCYSVYCKGFLAYLNIALGKSPISLTFSFRVDLVMYGPLVFHKHLKISLSPWNFDWYCIQFICCFGDNWHFNDKSLCNIVMLILCDKTEQWSFKDVHNLILTTSDYVALHGKRDFADVTKLRI